MSDEPIEDLTPEPVAPKSGNPWIPLIVIVLLTPAVTYATLQFLFMPQLKKALGDQIMAQTGEGHEEAQYDYEPVKDSGGHGGGGHGGGHGEEGGNPHSYEFKNIVANLTGSMKSRYVKVSFLVEGSHDDFAGIIEQNRAKLIDTTLTVLSSLRLSDLDEPGIKNMVRADLINAYETALRGHLVEELYFSEFVVQ